MKSGRNTLLIAISFGLFIDVIYYTNSHAAVDINKLFLHLNLTQKRVALYLEMAKYRPISCKKQVVFSCFDFPFICSSNELYGELPRYCLDGIVFQMIWNIIPGDVE